MKLSLMDKCTNMFQREVNVAREEGISNAQSNLHMTEIPDIMEILAIAGNLLLTTKPDISTSNCFQITYSF